METLVLVKGSVITTSRSLPAGARLTLVGGPTFAGEGRQDVENLGLVLELYLIQFPKLISSKSNRACQNAKQPC